MQKQKTYLRGIKPENTLETLYCIEKLILSYMGRSID